VPRKNYLRSSHKVAWRKPNQDQEVKHSKQAMELFRKVCGVVALDIPYRNLILKFASNTSKQPEGLVLSMMYVLSLLQKYSCQVFAASNARGYFPIESLDSSGSSKYLRQIEVISAWASSLLTLNVPASC
jgi:hypothetical protein